MLKDWLQIEMEVAVIPFETVSGSLISGNLLNILSSILICPSRRVQRSKINLFFQDHVWDYNRPGIDPSTNAIAMTQAGVVSTLFHEITQLDSTICTLKRTALNRANSSHTFTETNTDERIPSQIHSQCQNNRSCV